MGRFVRDLSKVAMLRPVYKKTVHYRGNDFEYTSTTPVSRELRVNSSLTILLISESGFMRTNQTGLLAIPSTGWLYADQGKMVGDDDTLTFIYN